MFGTGRTSGSDSLLPRRGPRGERENVGTHRLRMFAAGAAFACFFATMPIYSPNIVALNAFSVPEVTTWFSQGVLGFTLLAAVLTALQGLAGHKASKAVAGGKQGTEGRDGTAPSTTGETAPGQRDAKGSHARQAQAQGAVGSSRRTDTASRAVRDKRGRAASGRSPHVARAGLAVPLAYFMGGAGYTALVAAGTAAGSPVVNALGLACALLAGLSSVAMSLAWARVFSRETLSALLLTAGVGIACAALLNLAAGALPGVLPFLAHVALLAVGSFAPCFFEKTEDRAGRCTPKAEAGRTHGAARDNREGGIGPGATAGSPTKAAAAGRAQSTATAPERLPAVSAASSPNDGPALLGSQKAPLARAFISVMGTPLLGIALSSFVIGIAPTTVLGGAVDTQVLGSILAGVVLAGVCVVPRRGSAPTSSLVQRLVVPVAASAALALCAFPGVGQDTQVIASYTLFSLVGAVALAMGCGISNAQEFSRGLVFSTVIGTYCLTAILGLAVGGWLEGVSAYHFSVVVALMAAYGVFVIASSCLHATRPAVETAEGELLLAEAVGPAGAGDPGSDPTAGRPSAGTAAPQATPPVDALVELLAARYALTPRETEIVGILGRGHGCSYVADTLLISKSTVYTHVRNIYRKLDVSNHDGLIAKIYEQG